MSRRALLVSIFATTAQAQVTPSTPISVTGHAWAPFISPMGEPFRAHTIADDTLADWFRSADRDHDGMLSVDEMRADAERFFAKLDTNHDGQIDPDELASYEWDIAPDIQVNSRTRNPPGVAAPIKAQDGEERRSGRGRWRPGGGEDDGTVLGIGGGLQGAARYGLLNMPEPVAAADTNFDRIISLGEFKEAATARFQLLDAKRTGTLNLAQLQALRPPPPAPGHTPKRDANALDRRVGNPLPPGN
jgi:Ca2+-binding EF-hand superfamily protein